MPNTPYKLPHNFIAGLEPSCTLKKCNKKRCPHFICPLFSKVLEQQFTIAILLNPKVI